MKNTRIRTQLVLSFSFIFLFFSPAFSLAQTDWSEGTIIPESGRENILNLAPESQQEYIHNGRLHAQIYPVDITGALAPLNAIQNIFNRKNSNLFQSILKTVAQEKTGYASFDDLLKGLGLHPYPNTEDQGVYAIPYPNNQRPNYRVGFGTIPRYNAIGFTFSCAACHSANLFGKTILGMTNRFPHANEYFYKMKKISPLVEPLINTWLFDQATSATPNEKLMISETLKNLGRVHPMMPIAEGLDTSLAHTSLSLNRRLNDEWATPSLLTEFFPRKDDFLDLHPSDSKPAVWWNLKYKNRWLSDGSVVSGNPIITNLLWNEIGRGTDLKLVQNWISANIKKVDEITAAIFATEAPRITDFYSEQELGGHLFVEKAKKGEIIFNNNCAKCHGQYEKVWTNPGTESLSFQDLIKTSQVKYKTQTRVIDVGTDPNRYLGMKSLEKMNNLKISKNYGVVVKAQTGYVPPPLVGIWSRWPYFHNNSIPDLCTLLTPAAQRIKVYFSGEANNKNTDFDKNCNGYPTGEKTPLSWRTALHLYNTAKEGMHNSGHDERILVENGQEKLSPDDKENLIRFLQTL